ncbi:hypothetical protein IEU95_10280 [Hoyosella rhizosphaerae]|uniref:Uncharacterized protein n=1 Tax=Hoyosella rhizosphaerae TaxID=1755582 RepID=A0A916TZM9_9ACTN|nr:neocarzinostatin apoprotein domain-containing protein [Hoyosella rhizosphaerae]MBN4927222.1 hypothetical protein [Hoyosella rhizosphaerae]GGC53041.1 hypothetical protein GCM10011410_01720 [Hoyosella rhizosphaerae]
MKTQHCLAVALTTTVATLTIGSAVATAEPTLAVEPSTGLTTGDSGTVTGSGFDPEAGYYLSTCVFGTSGPSGPECAGSPSERGTSTWVTDNPPRSTCHRRSSVRHRPPTRKLN